MHLFVMNGFPGYLALSVGVAGGDQQARVGAVWVGWWESSKPSLPDRRAFVTRVGREGERKFSLRDGGRA
jgi:nicotinamide mononucleotide (NMN) deamidase PncC